MPQPSSSTTTYRPTHHSYPPHGHAVQRHGHLPIQSKENTVGYSRGHPSTQTSTQSKESTVGYSKRTFTEITRIQYRPHTTRHMTDTAMMIPGGFRGDMASLISGADTYSTIGGVCVHIEASLLNGAHGRIWMLRLSGIGVMGIGSTGMDYL